MRLLIQAAYFIIIARCLGPGQYGGFIAATALTAVISPFVGLGCGPLLIKNVSRDRRLFSEYWGNGLMMTLVSGSVLTFLAMALCRLVLPRSIPMLVITLISISDLIFMKLLDMGTWAFQSVERLSGNAQLNVLVSLTRLFGIAGLALAVSHPGVMAWSAVYLAGSIVAALIAVAWVTFSLGKPKLALHRIRGEGAEGFYFSVSLSAATIYNDIDKTMVARLATLEAAGVYGAAYRLIDVAFIPVRALLSATLPGFFRAGAGGLQASMRYGKRMLMKVLPYSLFAFAALHARRAAGAAHPRAPIRRRYGSPALARLVAGIENTALFHRRCAYRRGSPGNSIAHPDRRRRLQCSHQFVDHPGVRVARCSVVEHRQRRTACVEPSVRCDLLTRQEPRSAGASNEPRDQMPWRHRSEGSRSIRCPSVNRGIHRSSNA